VRSAAGCRRGGSIGPILGPNFRSVLGSIRVLRCIERLSDVVVLVELLDLFQELAVLKGVLNYTNSRLA
jgi:hypothetical protein